MLGENPIWDVAKVGNKIAMVDIIYLNGIYFYEI